MNVTENETLTSATVAFDSWDDFIQWIETSKPAGRCQSANADKEKTWDLCSGFDGAVHLAQHGWPEGAEAVKRMASQIREVVGTKVMLPDWAYDVQGECVEVGKFLTGEPECMISFHEIETVQRTGRIIRVTINTWIGGWVNARNVVHRGGAILALLDALELCGYSTEVCLNRAADGRKHFEIIVPIKAAGETLDLDRIAYTITHPATNRRLMFRVCEMDGVREYSDANHGGYGHESAPHAPGDIHVRGCGAMTEYNEMNTVADAVRWTLDTLKANGVEILEGVKS